MTCEHKWLEVIWSIRKVFFFGLLIRDDAGVYHVCVLCDKEKGIQPISMDNPRVPR